jgi:ABC-type Fe3+/spermidine/putrescine transport system ATPase subunit
VLHLDRVSYTAGSFSLRDVTLQVARGEYCVLLGKPGSGKTLLLECVAGLRRLHGGTITLDGQRLDCLPPWRRRVGYVPQDYALFSARTVKQNIAFGLRVSRLTASEREARVDELVRMLGIGHLLDRGTEGLSGGERQRVALARALAVGPSVLLLDEPVSALDEETRDTVLADLEQVQRQTGTTILHVCHNTDEMQLVAQQVAVMEAGRVVQVGTPEEVWRHPASARVAGLLRLGTVLTGTARKHTRGATIDFGPFSLNVETEAVGQVQVLIPAQAVRVAPIAEPGGLEARVRAVRRRSTGRRVELEIGNCLLQAEAAGAEDAGLRCGRLVRAVISSAKVHVVGEC